MLFVEYVRILCVCDSAHMVTPEQFAAVMHLKYGKLLKQHRSSCTAAHSQAPEVLTDPWLT